MMDFEQERSYTRRRFISVGAGASTALYLAACGNSSSSTSTARGSSAGGTATLKKAGVSTAQLSTWDGVVAALKAIKAKGIVKYPWMGSWAQQEAVVCDFAQFLGAFGGSFLDASGKPAFQTGGGLKALEFMK